MLFEIKCNKFQRYDQERPAIRFSSGLNTILGDESGSNSIGKSTFLMIVDFAFGGDDYIYKSTDVHKEIGVHTIKFAYKFKDKLYYFSRSTGDYTHVNICDAEYNTTDTKSIDSFRKFLFEQYKIALPDISFRAMISRFFRIYGRENLDEKRPLHTAHDEKHSEAIKSLLKLFDKYSAIIDLEKLANESKNKKAAFQKAQKYQFIPSIKKRQYDQNQKQIIELQAELQALINTSSTQLLGLDSQDAEMLSALSGKLSITKRERSRLKYQLTTVMINAESNLSHLESNYGALTRFFPETNIKHLKDIEKFHQKISDILRSEFQSAITNLNALIKTSNIEINSLEQEIQAMGVTSKISKAVLDKYASIDNTIQTFQKQNDAYAQAEELTVAAKELNDRFTSFQTEITAQLQNDINIEMDEINDYIYTGRKQAPILAINSTNSYMFKTPNDGGTGTNYKGLVVFDLAMLHLTALPSIAHDSILLKQIGDAPLERILEIYKSSDKQIFITLDKESSYSPHSQEILNKTMVLQLSENGNELFGRSWNEKQNKKASSDFSI